jgi:hypothetical protein
MCTPGDDQLYAGNAGQIGKELKTIFYLIINEYENFKKIKSC